MARTGRAAFAGVLFTDILIPQFRVLLHKLFHQGLALLVLYDLDGDTAAFEPFLLAHKRAILTGYDVRNTVKHDGTAAHSTG